MAAIRGWARKLRAADAVTGDLVAGIHYDERSRPKALTLLFTQRHEEGETAKQLEIRLDARESRSIGDAVVDFLTKLES